jgi:hypothetical protein
MWHLEGKGSRRLPQHDGGSLVNRWNFSRTWIPKIVPDVIGRTPQHRLLGGSAETPPQVDPEPSPGEARADRPAAPAKPDGAKAAIGDARVSRPGKPAKPLGAVPAKPQGVKPAAPAARSPMPRTGPTRSRAR